MVSELECSGKKGVAGTVEALAMVADCEVVEAGGAGLGVGGEVTAVDQFQFEAAPEACHGGMVVALAVAEKNFVSIGGTTEGS